MSMNMPPRLRSVTTTSGGSRDAAAWAARGNEATAQAALEQASAGKLDEAKASLEKLAANKGDGFHVRMTLAMVLSKLGDHKAALPFLERALASPRIAEDPRRGAELAFAQGSSLRELGPAVPEAAVLLAAR